MLAIQCPSCQHKNTPGERFCEFCGVPLDLKPCPNCGKVDLVTARICAGCGEVFPHIALAPDRDAAEAGSPAGNAPGDVALPPRRRPTYTNTVQAPPSGNEAPPSRALPLILVAIVAGGIPLLWMNRDRMPLPKAWQVQGVHSESAHPESTPPQPMQAPTAVLPPAAAKADPPQEERDRERAAKQEPAEQKAPAKKDGQASAPSAARQRENARPPSAGTQGAVPPRECTEAVAALGLCERKPKRD